MSTDQSDFFKENESVYEPEQITIDAIKQIHYELGLVTLAWPPIENVQFDNRTKFPETYTENTDKEKLALLYAENFRKQYIHSFPNRRPLILAVENECGLQKMVCTTVCTTPIPYFELKQWDSCANFVADFINYEPLDKPTLPPERIAAPATTLERQSGNSFELATVLCSLLIGGGYDAYVVSGYATRDITLRLLLRSNCPVKADKFEEEEEEEEVMVSKYRLRSVRDLRSKFLIYLEQREIDRAEKERERVKEQRRKEMEELEKPPHDNLHGWRVHAWVLLLPKREITEVTFVEPSTGNYYNLYDALNAYTSIESIWNDQNYWVNVQSRNTEIPELKFDLQDLDCWEHIFAGEPVDKRRYGADAAEGDYDPVTGGLDEKHLDVPTSWSEPLYIPHAALKYRYPNGSRISYYKRVILEQYGDYVQLDGLTNRITYYSDLEYENQLTIEEIYANREDCLTTIFKDLQTHLVTEYFKLGRDGACRVHTFYSYETKIEARRLLEFYHKSRIDGLVKLDMDPLYLKEYFINREDKLYFRYTKFAPRGYPPKGMVEGVRRIVLSILEKYERNDAKSVEKDIAEREFALIDNEIRLKYHYGKSNITASTRVFIKPNVAEMGEDLTFNPHLTSGYQADISKKAPKQLHLFYLLQQQLNDEEKVLFHLREIEDEVAAFVRLRAIEGAFIHLKVSLFNQEHNEDYKIGMKEREQQMKESKEREIDEDIDYLAPYIMRMGPDELKRSESVSIRNQCLVDFKQLLLDRAIQMQNLFDRNYQKMLKDQQEYEAKIGNMTREDEEIYLKQFSKKKYEMNLLETRLTRHKELSPQRYKALEIYLDNDRRLRTMHSDKS